MKRQRLDITPTVGGPSFVPARTRRPIDKLIIAINKDGVDATQVATTLLITTFPCTIVGLRTHAPRSRGKEGSLAPN